MPGLIRGVARTAAIAGTATAVSNGVSRRQRGKWAEQDAQKQQAAYGQPQYGQPQYGQPQYGQPQYAQPQYAQPQYPQPQAPAAPEPPAAPDMNEIVSQLKQLGELRDAGILTEEEFAAQKARLLGT